MYICVSFHSKYNPLKNSRAALPLIVLKGMHGAELLRMSCHAQLKIAGPTKDKRFSFGLRNWSFALHV